MSKAEDLMIGDWLFYKGPFNAFPFKVKQITKKKVGYHAEPNESRIYYVRLCECYPIPLTPKILEKNGFTYFTGLWYFQTEERMPIQICFKDNDTILMSINCNPVFINLKYVHQLQHALRLYGIKKDIQL